MRGFFFGGGGGGGGVGEASPVIHRSLFTVLDLSLGLIRTYSLLSDLIPLLYNTVERRSKNCQRLL